MQQDGGATLAQGSMDDGGLTVAQAAERLGISTDAVRRRLKTGELCGHHRQTKHGAAWCVHPDDPPGSRNGPETVGTTLSPDLREGSETVAQGSVEPEPSPEAGDHPEQIPVTALMQAEAMAAYTRSVLEPLVAALERSEDHARELERENGRLGAELERAAAAVVALGAENEALRAAHRPVVGQETASAARPSTEPPGAVWWHAGRWLALVAGLALVIVAVVWVAVLHGG